MAISTRRFALMLLPIVVIFIGGFFIIRQLQPDDNFSIEDAFPYGEIRIAVDASYPPFAMLTDDALIGLDVDLGNAIGDALDMPVRFVPIGFDGLYDAVITDKVDMVLAALTINPALMSDVRYTAPYFNNGLLLISSADNPIEQMQDLPGNRLAYEFGSAADSEARQWARRLSDFDLRPYELPSHALDALRFGDADAALIDATSFYLYENQHPDWQTEQHYLTDIPFAIALRIDRINTWDATNWALKSLWDDGTLIEIIQKWL